MISEEDYIELARRVDDHKAILNSTREHVKFLGDCLTQALQRIRVLEERNADQ